MCKDVQKEELYSFACKFHYFASNFKVIQRDKTAFSLNYSHYQQPFKGIVHPTMKIQSMSTHPHAYGCSGDVF